MSTKEVNQEEIVRQPEGIKPFTKYTDLDRLRGMALIEACDGDLDLASKQTTVPYEVLLLWSKQREAGLNKRLERMAYQLLAIMPDKLEEADLAQLTRALGIVLDNLDRTEEEAPQDVYERLSQLIDRYRQRQQSAGVSHPPDAQGSL